MSLSAVQTWCQGQLKDVTASTFGPTQVYIAPPQVGSLENPALFIWGARFHESRRTLGRSSGKKRIDYEIFLWLKAQYQAQGPSEDSAFPQLIEAVMSVLRTGPGINTPITDPDTLVTSYLLEVGEEFEVDYPGPTDIVNEGFRLYEAQIKVTAQEDRTG